MAILRAEKLCRYYYPGGEEVRALDGADLLVQDGEFLAILGPSGSGKSTLFNLIATLDRPSSGRLFFRDQLLNSLSDTEQARFRCRELGYIFQAFHLAPALNVLENTLLPQVFAGNPGAEGKSRARAMLERVGLANLEKRRPWELSGGQQQRVAIARALMNGPSLILADEPTGNLDTDTAAEIIGLLREINEQESVTVVCSTHDPQLIPHADRVCQMRGGRIL